MQNLVIDNSFAYVVMETSLERWKEKLFYN